MSAAASNNQLRIDRTKSAVLAAGSQILSEQGIRGVTVERITRRTGIAKTTIYRHWASAADLVMEIVARDAVKFVAPETGDALDDLRVQLREFSASIADPSGRLSLLGTLEHAIHVPSVDEAHRAFLDGQGKALVDALRRGIQLGQFRSDAANRTTIELLVGPILMRALLYGEAMSDADLDGLFRRVLV